MTAELDRLWQENSKIARTGEEAGLVYWLAHAGAQLGTIAWDWHVTLPTGVVFRSGKKISAVIWNPDAAPRQAGICRGAVVLRTVTVPPRSLKTEVLAEP